jgi:uncharacterized protein (DUF2461 family)
MPAPAGQAASYTAGHDVRGFPGLGFYLQVSADGVAASGGFHAHAPDQVERYRRSVDAGPSGTALAAIVAGLASGGLSIGGDQLKTRPRGVPSEHPRLDLLRHRSLTASRDWPAGPPLHSREALSLVRETWRQLVPLCDWLGEHVGGPQA